MGLCIQDKKSDHNTPPHLLETRQGLFQQYICSVVIPAHFEVPENALPEVVDAEEAKRQLAVTTAVQWVNESMTEQLWGLIPFNQAEVDSRLRIFFENKVQEDKERRELERSPEEPVLVPSPLMPQPPPPPAPKKKGQKQGRRDTLVEKPVLPAEPPEPILHGSMAIGAVSLAVIKASAHLTSTPLYMSITSLKHGQQPITGKMSHLGCLNTNYDTIEQPLLLIQGVCSSLGLELGTNLHLAINCAAHELMDYSKGKYEVMVGAHKNMAEMMELYVDLINKYPFIIALIDPFRKEDSEQWDSIYTALASRCYIIAGAASRSISKVLEHRNTSTPKSHGLIISHTNQTTMSDLVEISHLLDSQKQLAIFGSTEAESSDDSLVDLAVGLGARFIKLGGLSRGERVTKYNRLLTIEEELIQSGTWGFSEEHNFSSFQEDAEKTLESTAMMAEETLGPLESIFPTEV
ncbi:Enolase-like protein C10orf134-like [Cricetulus griseus]|uniref:phosphopyruvate hydratase n=1 Tax=Cricetulus griseus TaxID=10029 RepID=G3H7P8_CRIGR|nr:Enolase-like protein C10orf134-like [Cricetulus griseus]